MHLKRIRYVLFQMENLQLGLDFAFYCIRTYDEPDKWETINVEILLINIVVPNINVRGLYFEKRMAIGKL